MLCGVILILILVLILVLVIVVAFDLWHRRGFGSIGSGRNGVNLGLGTRGGLRDDFGGRLLGLVVLGHADLVLEIAAAVGLVGGGEVCLLGRLKVVSGWVVFFLLDRVLGLRRLVDLDGVGRGLFGLAFLGRLADCGSV